LKTSSSFGVFNLIPSFTFLLPLKYTQIISVYSVHIGSRINQILYCCLIIIIRFSSDLFAKCCIHKKNTTNPFNINLNMNMSIILYTNKSLLLFVFLKKHQLFEISLLFVQHFYSGHALTRTAPS
jgi:hypothetical protein